MRLDVLVSRNTTDVLAFSPPTGWWMLRRFRYFQIFFKQTLAVKLSYKECNFISLQHSRPASYRLVHVSEIGFLWPVAMTCGTGSMKEDYWH